jgi:N-acyl-D-amino-acid deacylase
MLTRRAFLASSVAATGSLLAPRVRAADELPITGAHNANLTPFDDLFVKFMKENALPGAGVAVTHNGRLVYARGFGHANIENKRPVAPDALFRIASVSKPFTAVGILHLVENGKLKLEDHVLKHVSLEPFLPEGKKMDERWSKITVRHCLNHTGGWDRDKKGGFDPINIPWQIMKSMKLANAPTPEDIVRYMMGHPLDFDPGAKMVYSNLGYLVLGRIIESVTGEKYAVWMKKHIMAPVKITQMALGRGLPENRAKGEVHYYDSKKRMGRCLYPPRMGEQVPLADGAENVEGFEAHGGWIASPVDLVRFASAFDYGQKSPLLSQEIIKEMWARPEGLAGFNAKGKPLDAYYGCGWQVTTIANTNKVNTWHVGLLSGTSTLMVRCFDGLNWAVLFNTDANSKNQKPADLIDSLMHDAADAVKKWPDHDLFEKFPA